MLQGVNLVPQQCHEECAPKFSQGVTKAPRTAPSALRPKGAAKSAQKCHGGNAPRERSVLYRSNAKMANTSPNFLQGVRERAQKCLSRNTPASFIWAAQTAQKCHSGPAQGRDQEQRRSNANPSPPLPPFLFGAIIIMQQCQNLNAPREKPLWLRRNANPRSLFPTNYRRPCEIRRNAIAISPQGGHKIRAAMPNKYRPRQIWATSKPQKCNANRAQ
jgi:hypothetical protein